ncbi:hypothetical protein L579_1683 [Pantoea sp. AS-PWVM4]|nr:hypothetical protein L579_1683 [Pantoea sp. AS-PWVM4]
MMILPVACHLSVILLTQAECLTAAGSPDCYAPACSAAYHAARLQ